VVRTARTGLLAAALLAAAAGCGDGPATAPPPEDVAAVGDEVAILRKFPASSSGGYAAAANEVHRDAASFAAAWKKASAHLAPPPAAPPVDFATEMVALAALGRKPNAGWGVEIVGLRRTDAGLRILYAVREPAAGEMSATVLTNPWHAVVVPREDGPVEWALYTPPGAPPKAK